MSSPKRMVKSHSGTILAPIGSAPTEAAAARSNSAAGWKCNTCNTMSVQAQAKHSCGDLTTRSLSPFFLAVLSNTKTAAVCELCHEPKGGAAATSASAKPARRAAASNVGSGASMNGGGALGALVAQSAAAGSAVGTRKIVTTTTSKGPNGSVITTTHTKTIVTRRVPMGGGAAGPLLPAIGTVASAGPVAKPQKKKKKQAPSEDAAAAVALPALDATSTPAATKPAKQVKPKSTVLLTSLQQPSAAPDSAADLARPSAAASPSSSVSASPPPSSASSSPSPPLASDDPPAQSSWRCGACKKAGNSGEAIRCSVCAALSPHVSKDALKSTAPPVPPVPLPPRLPRGQIAVPRAVCALPATVAAYATAATSTAATAASASAAIPLTEPYGALSVESEEQWAAVLAAYSPSAASSSAAAAAPTLWCDPDFPADNPSIYGVAALAAAGPGGASRKPATSGADPTKFGPIEWRRARDCLIPNENGSSAASSASVAEWCLTPFNADGSIDISPRDVRQGRLGNCYWLSALCVLAERPALLSHLLLTPELNSLGAYQFRFCKSGLWRTVTVDDRLPVVAKAGCFAFSCSPTRVLWVALLEKAAAKLTGSYAALESGSLFEALTDLTGAPSERLELHAEAMSRYGSLYAAAQKGEKALHEILWSHILLARASRFLLGASCGRRDTKPIVFQQVGLRSDHAYALLDARQVDGGVQLVKLRNPWGVDSWTGDWSATSNRWTPALREALDYYPDGAPSTAAAAGPVSSIAKYRTRNASQSSGIFWMSFQDFLRYFRTIDICKVQDSWSCVRLAEHFPASPKLAPSVTHVAGLGHECMLLLRPTRPTYCFISLVQVDQRGSATTVFPYKYRNVGAFLVHSPAATAGSGSDAAEAPLSSYSRVAEVLPAISQSLTMEALLSRTDGCYTLLPLSFSSVLAKGSGSSSFPLRIVIYSAHPIEVLERKPLSTPILTRAMHVAVRARVKPELTPGVTLFPLSYQGGTWMLAANTDASRSASVHLDLTGSTGLVCSRGRNSMKIEEVIAPRTQQLLFACISPKAEGGYAARRRFQSKFVDLAHPPSHTPPLMAQLSNDIHVPMPID